MNIQGVVWGSTFEGAKEKYNEIKEGYKWAGIPIVKETNGPIHTFIEYENGDRWRIARASDSSKGIKCNISYVDRMINLDIINCIIRPSTMMRPFNALHFYGNYPEGYEGPWLL